MARARSGGGLAVALVLFIIAFVFALIAAIVFASQKAAAVSERDTAERKLREVALPNEIQTIQKPAESGGGTLVGYLNGENQLLKSMISSQPEVSASSLDERRKALGVEQALLDEVQRQQNELAALVSRAQRAEETAEQANQRAAAAEASKASLSQGYTTATNDLRTQIKTVSDGVQVYREGIKGSDAALAAQMAELRREKDTRIAELEQQARQKDAELARMQTELTRLVGEKDVVTGETVIRADGQITGLGQDNHTVYLSLGAREHLLPGTTFEVFADKELVRTDEYNQVRGKATLEVLQVDDAGSQARIVRQSHRAILRAGDKIVNLVFDPDQTYVFHIYGDFDINGDGRPSEAERLAVESMIRSWGGRVSDTLTYEVDYLILGNEPPMPESLPPDVIDPVAIQRNVDQKRVYEQYQSLKGEADKFNIPVLNQNRFLGLVGYYER